MTFRTVLPTHCGPPTHHPKLEAVWTAGPYTKGLWHLNMPYSAHPADPVIVDSVNGNNLSPDLTYLPGPSFYRVDSSSAWPNWKGAYFGFDAPNLGDTNDSYFFQKLTASPALDIGATEHAVIQILLRERLSLGAGLSTCPFHTSGGQGTVGLIYTTSNQRDDTGLFGTFMVNSNTYVLSRSAPLSETEETKVRIVINRTTNMVSVYENGVLVGEDGFPTGAFVNTRFNIGGRGGGLDGFLGRVFAVKWDSGSDASVLNIDDGQPRTIHCGPPTRFP
jgi:hypothetical protein